MATTYRNYRGRSEFNIYAIVIGAALAAFAALVYFAIQEQKEWDAFAIAHECRVIAKHDGTTGYGMMSNGKMGTVYVPGTKTFRCNDGVDYTRSE